MTNLLGRDPSLPNIEEERPDRDGGVEASGLNLIKIIHKFFISGEPPFFGLLNHYARIRSRYFARVWVTGKDNRVVFELRLGSVVKWLLNQVCYLLDILVKLVGFLFIVAVLIILILALIKLFGLIEWLQQLSSTGSRSGTQG